MSNITIEVVKLRRLKITTSYLDDLLKQEVDGFIEVDFPTLSKQRALTMAHLCVEAAKWFTKESNGFDEPAEPPR